MIKFEETRKQTQSIKYRAAPDNKGFHKFIPPAEDKSLFDKRFIKSTIRGMNELLNGSGYPPGSVINLVSVPKAGKTAMCIHETLKMSQRGDDVLYMYNESIQDEFMRIVDRYRDDLGLERKDITNDHLTFIDRHRLSPDTASYKVIETFVDYNITNPIEGWLKKSANPKLIVIDSLTKFIRPYPAQAFVLAQRMMYNLKEMFHNNKKHPVVLCVNQKSSNWDKRDDESVMGGYGIVHDMDGSIVIRTETADSPWKADELGLERGSKVRWIRIEDIRLVQADTREHIFVRVFDEKTRTWEIMVGETYTELKEPDGVE